jgi:hypothetical protein
MNVETYLEGSELTEMDFRLKPLDFGTVEVDGLIHAGSVYHGALYVGETPLTLRLPLNQLDYMELHTPNSQKGAAVFQTPFNNVTTDYLYMHSFTPSAQGRVDRARRIYYWAWGGTWITGIAALLTYGLYNSYNDAVVAKEGFVDPAFYKKYSNMYYTLMAMLATAGISVGHEIFQIYRYVNTANKDSTPVIKSGSNKR